MRRTAVITARPSSFERMEEVLSSSDFDAIAYGINRDDTGDFRPGHKAAEEHRVLSPLLDAA